MEPLQERVESALVEGGTRTLTITGELENLLPARCFVADVAVSCGFSDEEVFDIKLATGEALANAVEHGSPLKCDNKIVVTCICKNGNFVVTIEDEGCFRKILPIPSDKTAYRGRGIPLMLSVMDKVTIDEKDDGTRVTLSKSLPNR
ncbi:MAG: ATP-binding protein [Candidatus Aquicultorales bacterium]